MYVFGLTRIYKTELKKPSLSLKSKVYHLVLCLYTSSIVSVDVHVVLKFMKMVVLLRYKLVKTQVEMVGFWLSGE